MGLIDGINLGMEVCGAAIITYADPVITMFESDLALEVALIMKRLVYEKAFI